MAKTKEELKLLKEEYDSVTKKLKELTDSELELVTGGSERAAIILKVIEPGPWGGGEDPDNPQKKPKL